MGTCALGQLMGHDGHLTPQAHTGCKVLDDRRYGQCGEFEIPASSAASPSQEFQTRKPHAVADLAVLPQHSILPVQL